MLSVGLIKPLMPKYLMNELDFGKTYTNLQETERSLPDEMTSYKLLLAARACFAKEDWFGAHYYSQMGLKMSSQKDINKIKLILLNVSISEKKINTIRT